MGTLKALGPSLASRKLGDKGTGSGSYLIFGLTIINSCMNPQVEGLSGRTELISSIPGLLNRKFRVLAALFADNGYY
jgi:hypothetical protein